VAYDNPIPGFRTPTCSNLRLWDAQPLEEFDLSAFNAGEYDKVNCAGSDASQCTSVPPFLTSSRRGQHMAAGP